MTRKAQPAPQEENETTSLEKQVKSLSVEDLEGVKKQKSFRNATAMLLAGEYTVDEWQWHAVRIINRRVDIPYLTEDQEGRIFNGAFEAIGLVLENILKSGAVTDLEQATLKLLEGEMKVDEWIDVVAEAADLAIDIPYVPGVGEDMIFDRGLAFLAKTLHGFLKTKEEGNA